MRHLKLTSRDKPATASLLEVQQKITVFGAFAGALGALGEALATLLSLGQDN